MCTRQSSSNIVKCRPGFFVFEAANKHWVWRTIIPLPEEATFDKLRKWSIDMDESNRKSSSKCTLVLEQRASRSAHWSLQFRDRVKCTVFQDLAQVCEKTSFVFITSLNFRPYFLSTFPTLSQHDFAFLLSSTRENKISALLLWQGNLRSCSV